MDRTPRGREWNLRALKMPDDAIPILFSAAALAVPTGTTARLLELQVPPGVAGRRFSLFGFMASAGSTAITWRLLRNGEFYHPALSDMQIGAAATFSLIPIFAPFEAGDFVQLDVENLSGANRDLSAVLIGWDFS